MNEAVWSRAEAESPCQRICVIHPGAGLCVGCFRTPEEISGWSRMAPDERRAVMAALPAREPRLTARDARPSARRRRRA